MAWLTFGEGYHNFHHEFQHDYRNGVRPWDFDPTKWCIWLLRQVRLVKQLRRVSYEKILLAKIAEQERQLSTALSATGTPVPDHVQQLLNAARSFLRQAAASWEERKLEYQRIMEAGMDASREKLCQVRNEVRKDAARFRQAVREWHQVRRLVHAHLG
jgi:stearoyl-CoA desaturase (delta-9 desaturase)